MQYKDLCIIHVVTGLLLSLMFYDEDPYRVGYTVQNFLFPDLSLSAVLEEALAVRRWDTELYRISLTTYSGNAFLLQNQKVAPIIGLEESVKIMKQWEVFMTVLLGPVLVHLAVYEIILLIYMEEEVSARLHTQYLYQPLILEALIQLIKTESNGSCWKVFTRTLPEIWPQMATLTKTLTTGHFRTEGIVMPGGFKDMT